MMVALLDMNSIISPNMGFSDERRREADFSFSCQLEGEGRVRKDILVEKRRGFEQYYVDGRKLGE